MRLPLLDENDMASIDEARAARMLHYAIDQGVNYVDTAFGYHLGASETFLGRALSKGYREKIYLATKSPVWLIKDQNDFMKCLEEQFARLKTDAIDMYLLHGLNQRFWKTVIDLDVLALLDNARARKKISYAGFSFHDELPLFKEIVDAYAWSFCQIHLNYVDKYYQAGLEGLEYACQKGLAVVIMEPLRGGKLARKVPVEVVNVIKRSGQNRTAAEFAFRYLYSRPEVSCVLSGMSTMEQVKENLRIASEAYNDQLTSKELALYARARKIYKSKTKINCTSCGYCLPCAQNIPISFIFDLYNDAYMYDALVESQGLTCALYRPATRRISALPVVNARAGVRKKY